MLILIILSLDILELGDLYQTIFLLSIDLISKYEGIYSDTTVVYDDF